MTNPINLFEYINTTKKPIDSFKFIDLFAGIGGIRLGFESAGGKCVFTSEWDKFAQITYKANFHDKVFGDITKIEASQIPKFDVLCAGFPCQPFSQAGLKKGFADTRGRLFFDVARIIEHHRPKVVFLENVKRFKTHDNGNTFNVVETILKDLGYNVLSKVLNAKDFGLPQNRERIFIVAFLGQTNFTFPQPTNEVTKLGNILDNNIDEKYTISDKLWLGHQTRKKAHLEKGFGFGYSLFNHNSIYASTISARYYKDGSEILIEQKDKNPRKLTPKEASRLQGFPDNFKIPVSDNQAYKQFGNSVAVNVVKKIAFSIAISLNDFQIKNSNNLDKVNIEEIKQNILAVSG